MTQGALNYCESFAKLTNETLQALSFVTIQVNNLIQVDLFGTGQYTTINHPSLQCVPQQCIYSEFDTDIRELRKIDIEKRMLVIKNYLFYQKNTLEAITQRKIEHEIPPTIRIRDTILYTKDEFCPLFNCYVSSGFWHTERTEYSNRYFFGFDIISLFSYLQNINYSASTNQLQSFFESRKFIHRASSFSSKELYEQEKNPISYNSPVFFDRFYCKFGNTRIVPIHNSHNRFIGVTWELKTKYGETVEIYFTFWRHIDSVLYTIYPLPPHPPYDLYFNQNDFSNSNNNKEIFICNSLSEFNNTPSYNGKKNALLYGGIKSIIDSDISAFAEYKIYFRWQDSISYGFLKLVERKFKENRIKGYLIDKEYKSYPLIEIINFPEKIGLKRTNISSGITGPDEQIAGSARKREILLDPIIESGTITWLFAAEKVGKTLLALRIAHAIGAGHQTIGTWKSLDPKSVLYIDGEMSGDKLQSHIDRIIRGLGNNPEIHKKAFSTYLFAEQGFDYSSILDDAWQNEYLDELVNYDMIILDNYYTLHESNNPISLIRWMKKIASQHGIAFLVLDHTNSEGELQGSMVKRRAMDLGIQLSNISQNEISIDFLYDRFGCEHRAEKFTLTKCFTTSEIKITSKILGDDLEKLSNFTDIEKRILAIYILKNQKMKNNDISKALSILPPTVTKDLQRIGLDSNLKKIQLEPSTSDRKMKNLGARYKKIITVAENLLQKNIELDALLSMI